MKRTEVGDLTTQEQTNIRTALKFLRGRFGTWELVAKALRFGDSTVGNVMHPIACHLTQAGIRLLESDQDHPLLPGFVDRLVKRCAGLPDDVTSLMTDARACLDVGLMRPAIVLVGVAYEMAIERIAETLVTKAHLKPADLELNSAKLLVKVKAQVKNVLLDREQQFAADAACDFADQLRRRRNDAAHTAPTYGFEDREEAEEFVVSAGRHMPHLWRMH